MPVNGSVTAVIRGDAHTFSKYGQEAIRLVAELLLERHRALDRIYRSMIAAFKLAR
jgi:hypothetical protein